VIPRVASFLLAEPLFGRRINWELDLEQLLRGAAKGLVILLLAYVAWRALRRLARRMALRAQAGDLTVAGARMQRAATLAQILSRAGTIVIVMVAGLLFLDIFINIGPLLAGAGVLGVAVSLGGQSVMKDIIFGFLIVLEDQYVVGDRVRIGDVEGTVQVLALRSTVVRSDDGALHFISNGTISSVANLSRRNAGAGRITR